MLELLEHSVRELGGTYPMEDTDSMAIVATEHGGLISCSGGLKCGDGCSEAQSFPVGGPFTSCSGVLRPSWGAHATPSVREVPAGHIVGVQRKFSSNIILLISRSAC
jgi:hypothetical protein